MIFAFQEGRAVLYAILGYLLGSVMFAPFWGRLLAHKDIVAESRDQNPGTANAYLYGGFLCGTLTLLCDIGKGFLPVFLYFRTANGCGLWDALVLAAPVAGHVFSFFHRFHGGKGIATTFGVLLGLVPNWVPVLVLAFFFIFYSVVIQISPHALRTIITYFSTMTVLLFGRETAGIKTGFFLTAFFVIHRLWNSDEKREKSQVRLLWKR